MPTNMNYDAEGGTATLSRTFGPLSFPVAVYSNATKTVSFLASSNVTIGREAFLQA